MGAAVENLPLSKVQAFAIECAECGRVRWVMASKLVLFDDPPAWRAMRCFYCSDCREAKRPDKNLAIEVVPKPAGYMPLRRVA